MKLIKNLVCGMCYFIFALAGVNNKPHNFKLSFKSGARDGF